MIFKEGSALYATEVERKQGEEIIYINFMGASIVPSISDDSSIMEYVITLLADNPEVSRIVFVQQRNYNYPANQVLLLSEIARIYNYLTKQENLLSLDKIKMYGDFASTHNKFNSMITLLKQDPLGFYMLIKKTRSNIEGVKTDNYKRLIEKIYSMISECGLIKLYLSRIQDNAEINDAYRAIFRPDILPNFTFTRLVAQIPADAKFIDQYEIKSDFETATVTILKNKTDAKYFYHIMPPEYTLNEEHHSLLNLGRNVLIEHRPKAEEFTDPEKTRQVFFNVARDLLSELATSRNITLNYRELNKLSRILVRYTIGYGLIEVLLMDEKLQDIVLNAPIAQNSIFVRHQNYEECVTNIIPSYEDADSWAGKLRLQSGRPLDEANPVLDTDLVFGKVRARVAAVKEPLSPSGLAYAIRRHRDNPWTLPLFIKNKMINSFTAGLLSFLVDGNRTLLVAGTRSSGKTSLLGALMLEVIPKARIIVIEDTLELPVDSLRKNGYDVLRMKVRSAVISGSTEVEASEGIRTSLRLGDSALIVGEVRSSEARALYEAMRVGALANVVAGTIHGDSAYGVFDRVVNDLDVPATSFKATDFIIVTNPIKSADGMHSKKRLTAITEVRKQWDDDPLREKGFVDLVRYNVEKDEIEPTPELMNGESEIIKAIAGNVKGWAGNWDAVYDNIILRGKCKQEIVEVAERLKKPQVLEATFNVIANNEFHKISDEVMREFGLPLNDEVFPRWRKWLVDFAEKF